MTDRAYIVRKVPDADDFDGGDYFDCGIYPSGEIMGLFETRERAQKYIDILEENGPSKKFGETMDDAPYQFLVTGYVVLGARSGSGTERTREGREVQSR